MALSADTKNRMGIATALGTAGAELATAVDAATAATSAVTGDITLSAAGVAAIVPAKLASANSAWIVTDAGTKVLLAAAAVDRQIVGVVTVTTAFANGDGAQPTLTVDEESTAAKFAAAAKFTSAAAGATIAFGGTLIAGKKLQATLVAGTGTTETGAYRITVLVVG